LRDIDWTKWIKSNSDDVVFGVELEFILFDLETKDILNNIDITEDVLSNLPNNIYRDYYPWQLEIRTNPTSDIGECLAETTKLYKEASKEFLDNNIMVIPTPLLSGNTDVFCGMHMHLSFPNLKIADDYWKKAMGIYPFALSIADHAKNSETSDIVNSKRFIYSRHIGLPSLKKSEFLSLSKPPEERKYRDIILSPPNNGSEGRHRLKKPLTIELRLFDTPSMFSMYSFIVESIVKLARYIRLDNFMVKELTNNYDEVRRKIVMTRNLIGGQRYGINKIFRMYNGNVCEAIAEYFNLSYPEETQFEIREKQNLDSNINGFLSMAIQGGWL